MSKDDSRVDVLHEVSTILSQMPHLEQGLRQIFQLLDKSCGLVKATLVLRENFANLQVEGSTILEQDPESLLHQLAKKALEEKTTQMQDLQIESHDPKIPSSTASLLAIPLYLEQSYLGALCVTQPKKGPDDQQEIIPFLSCLAAMLTHSLLLHRQSSAKKHADIHELDSQGPKISTSIRGSSKAIRRVFGLVGQVAPSDTSVLILGESGVGKELVASAIHDNSPRSEENLVKINCATLPDSLLESELFGHEKGSFTGATAQKKGRFEVAHGGTLFLDEIGEISLTTQVKLLRFLQEKEFERVGGTKTITADVRIIAATNRNLEAMIDTGDFRLDLYYRLNVFPIHVPALRERKPDIIPIADFFVERYNKVLSKSIRRISTPAIDLLVSYHWPGNVRELENCIERAVLLSTDDVIHSHHLPPSLQTAEARTRHQESLSATLESVERELISEALVNAKGNMAKASRALGLTERVMGLRTKKYALDPKKYRR